MTPPAMSATTCQTSPRVQRGGPHPNSGLPHARTCRPGEEKRSLPGKTVLECCVGSITDETPTSRLDLRWLPLDSPGSTSTGDAECQMTTLSADPSSAGFIFIRYLFIPELCLTI